MSHPVRRSAGLLRLFVATFLAGAAILVSAKAQPAADGIITGRVLGETSGQYLNNARLAVRGTGLVALDRKSTRLNSSHRL